MPGTQQWVTSPGVGFQLDELIVTLTASGASFVKGDFVQLVLPTASPWIWTSFVTPTNAAGVTAGYVFGVCVDAIAQNQSGKVAIIHPSLDVKVPSSNGAGSLLVSSNSTTLANSTGSGGKKIVALNLSGESGGVATCAFNGWSGFGGDNA